MKLVVGLGNPGGKYEATRHNVGFRVVDGVVAAAGIDVGRSRFSGLAGSGPIGAEQVVLLEPGTFMNLSGRSVREALTFYKLELADLLVIGDDMALPLGRLRVAEGRVGRRPQRAGQRHRGTGQRRVWPAADRDRAGARRADGRPRAQPVRPAGGRGHRSGGVEGGDAVECWLADGMDAAMNRFNKGEDKAGG